MSQIKSNFRPTSPAQPQKTTPSPSLMLPLKFKAIILKSIFDKHRAKQFTCKKEVFFKWYVQKNDDQLIKDHIDRLLIAENESKFTVSRFFYRIKYTVRKELAIIQAENKLKQQELQKQEQQKAEILRQNSHQMLLDEELMKQKSSNSQIKENPHCVLKNFTDYFESLRNIFSMKLLDSSGQLLGDDKNNPKHQRIKTEGCEVGTSVNQSFEEMCRLSVFREEKILELERKEGEIKRRFQEIDEKEMELGRIYGDKVSNIKELGKRVGMTLVRSFVLNKDKKLMLQAFVALDKHSQQYQLSQEPQMKKLQDLQLKAKLSSQINIQTSTNTIPTNSQSFLQSQNSSQTSIPPSSYIQSQISHVQYSISLLSQTIKKDNDLQELYKQFQAQFGEFQAIQKDFQMLRVKTRNSLFDRLINLKKKLQKNLITEAFFLIKQTSKTKCAKSHNSSRSRSRVNLETLHSVFSKPLISPNQPTRKFVQREDYQSHGQTSMTSLKMICDNNNNTEGKFYKPHSRGVIKKQTIKYDQTSMNNEVGSELNSTMIENNFKQKPTAVSSNPSSVSNSPQTSQSNSPYHSPQNSPQKSHVNFVIPNPAASSKWSTKQNKKSEVSLMETSINDGFRKKTETKMNSTGFYELSLKSVDSNESSSASKEYHEQLKTQYWWNDMEEKENLALRDGNVSIQTSGSSLSNQERD